ncbi:MULTISPECIES: hypothetical protein [unclassified Streptomyces]|uniref:hypothetical protein n=1 Tax=unclassified Streptomyces TaxID=2593676 RepID=UPI00131A7DC3|nr:MULTISPECIES: hypothetical protein [unclassified Streptomyces]
MALAPVRKNLQAAQLLRERLPVMWLGSAQSEDNEHAPICVCEPCVRRAEELVTAHDARRDAA